MIMGVRAGYAGGPCRRTKGEDWTMAARSAASTAGRMQIPDYKLKSSGAVARGGERVDEGPKERNVAAAGAISF